jgi:23S rRNA (uridine2552-2'-O)-methyltransferase
MARSKSSRRWLQRQHSDPYVRRARAGGLASRAVFKLEELDARERLLRPGMRVVDLGAAPGGWSAYAARAVGAGERVGGKVVAIDLLPMDVPAGVSFIRGDFRDPAVLAQLARLLGSRPVDLILSDMAPNFSGLRSVDQPRAVELAELALDLACRCMAPGGDLLVKLFQGEGFDAFVRQARGLFTRVSVRKPGASRPDSREVYLLARGYRAATDSGAAGNGAARSSTRGVYP